MHTEVDWARARQIFEAALGLDGEQRESYVIEHCGEDATLLRTVRGLLAADEPASPTEPGLFAQFQAFMEQEQIDAKLGQRIGPYEIERCLGHGGMGTVFYARRVDGQFKQEVAIKFLRPGLGTFERFLQERQVLGQLNHPGIAGILDGGLLNQQPYLVMHFVDGLELTQYLKQNKPTYLQRIQLLRHLCAAVQHAHQNLVVHRDLKPANILVTPEGQPVLLDFGIAKILDPGRHNFSDLETSPHVRLFSRRYASPEQLQGLRITTASDVYQLGQILWLLLLDTDREEGQSVPSAAFKKMAAAQRQDWVPELGMSGREYENKLRTDWDAIFLKATALEPQDRYASAHEFLLELDAVLESRPTQARAHHGSYVFWKWLHRSRHWVGGSMILLGMIGFFVLRLAHEKNEALRQSQRAQREKVRAEETKRFLIEAFQLANPRETKAGSMDLQMFIDKSAGELAGREWDPALRADLALHLGEVYLSLGRPDRAQPLLSEAKAYFEQNRESERLADAQLLLIRCGHMLGRDLEQVRQLAETTLSEWNAEPERYGTRILDLKLELAEILTSVGDYPESLKAYESALVLMDTHRVSGLKRGILFRDMGNVHYLLGNLDAAIQSVGESSEWLGQDRAWEADLGLSLAFLSDLMGRKGEMDQAMALGIQAEELITSNFGENHVRTGDLCHNLGNLFFRLKDYQTARCYYERSLAIKANCLGPDHVRLTTTLKNAAEAEARLGRTDEAFLHVLQAIEISENAGNQQNLPYYYGSLAKLRDEPEFWSFNAVCLEKALNQFWLINNPRGRDIATTQLALAQVYADLGRRADAKALAGAALAKLDEQFGSEHAFTVAAREILKMD